MKGKETKCETEKKREFQREKRDETDRQGGEKERERVLDVPYVGRQKCAGS